MTGKCALLFGELLVFLALILTVLAFADQIPFNRGRSCGRHHIGGSQKCRYVPDVAVKPRDSDCWRF